MPPNCWPVVIRNGLYVIEISLKKFISLFHDITCSENIIISLLFHVILKILLITHFMMIILSDFHWNFHKFTFFVYLPITISILRVWKNKLSINYTTWRTLLTDRKVINLWLGTVFYAPPCMFSCFYAILYHNGPNRQQNTPLSNRLP